MDDSDERFDERGGVVAPPPLPVVRKAAWWAWPLVLICLLPLDRIVWRFLPATAEGAKSVVENTETGSMADLALLKLQSQIVIATAKVDPASAQVALDDLSGATAGDRAVAAFAMLEAFVDPVSPRAREVLGRLSDRAPAELAEVARRAVETGLIEEERESLRSYLGWFADLAPASGLASPPEAEAIRARSFVVLVSMGLVFTAVCIGLVLGAILLFIHLRRVRIGLPVNAFEPANRHGGVFLECFALYLGIMVFGALASIWLGQVTAIAAYAAAVILPLVWPRLRGLSWSEFRAAVGLHRGKGWCREIAAGAVGYLGVMAIASIGIFLTLVLMFLAGAFAGMSGAEGGASAPGPEVHPIVGWLFEGSLWVKLACLFLAAGFAPLFEELFFRGALQRHLRGRFRFLPSALVGSTIFAALHPQGFFAIPALAGIGVGFSLLREWRDSLIAPMTAHAINNGCLVGILWCLL